MVSVVIPVKDGRENLRRLLDSLDRLEFPRERLEIVVCDNGSSDGTPALAGERGCRVLDLPGLSISGLRNRGAKEARGDVLAFVDSDCAVVPGWIDAALPHLERPEVAAAGNYPSPPERSTWVQELWTLNHRLKPRVHEAAWLPSMNLIVKREAFERVGGFDERLKTCEDVDLCYRLRERAGLIIWDEAIGVTHHGEPPTLRVLFRKERWHGSDNWRGLLHHGLRWEELPSLAIPVVVLGAYVLPLAALPAGLLTGPILPALTLPLLAVPPALAALAAVRIAARARRPSAVPRLTLIYLVYFSARAVALIPLP
jgi:glycosyltransferase involved in cell wall biosynthesis